MIRRILTIRSRRATERQVDDEVLFHIEMRIEALLRSGACATPDEARARAVREFGDLADARRELTAMDRRSAQREARADWWRDLAQDARYALRDFRRHAGFTAILIATLALGIGANVAIFTLIDAVQLRPLPVSQPERLVALGSTTNAGSSGASSTVLGWIFTYPVYRELRARNRYVSGLLAAGPAGRLDVLPNAKATELEHPTGRFVSGNYFSVLGVGASVGRTFDGSEDRSVGDAPVVVLSHGYWQRRFAGDSSIVGRQISIDRVSFTIIGVSARGFFGDVVGDAADMWIPVTMQNAMMPTEPRLDHHRRYWLQLLGRVKPGVTLAQAEAGSRALIAQVLAEEVRRDPANMRMPRQLEIVVGPGGAGFSALREDFVKPLGILMAGVGLLLLIVCANVGNLLLARAVARNREMAVRIAIGAGRARLVRQLLTESTVLALVAGAASLVVASWGSRLLLVMASANGLGIPLDVGLNLHVLGFAAAVSLAAVTLFGLAPAYRATRVDIAPILRAQGRGALARGPGEHGRRFSLTNALVVGQVALSLVLLVGAALLVGSLRGLERTNPGFDRGHLVVVDVDDAARGYTGERHMTLVRELSTRFAALPGVTGATFSENGLFSGSDWSTDVNVPGYTARTSADSNSRYDQVGPGYFRTIGAPIIGGREFAEHDAVARAPVAVVNQEFARFYFGAVNPIGRSISFDDSTNKPLVAEIVGVVGNVRTGETSRREGAQSLAQPPVRRFYVPYLQHPGDAPPTDVRFEIRIEANPASVIDAVRLVLSSIDPLLPTNDIYPLESRIHESIARERLLATLSSAFGAVALLLAALGLYGLMMHAVGRRTGELGLRMALGAGRGDIVTMVLMEALRLVGAGLVLGIPAAYAATRVIRAQVSGVGAVDVSSVAVAMMVLIAAAVAAAALPAIRAGRVTPIVALQQE